MQTATVERTANYNKVREDLVRLTYLYLASMNYFFGISLLGNSKAPPPHLLAHIFSGVLIWMQYLKRVCGKMCLCIKMSCLPRGNKGFGNLHLVILSEKMLIPHENITAAFH